MTDVRPAGKEQDNVEFKLVATTTALAALPSPICCAVWCTHCLPICYSPASSPLGNAQTLRREYVGRYQPWPEQLQSFQACCPHNIGAATATTSAD
ncbi:hypothetical protein E2C01_020823 [Portunus trituberculatus]|uniref:Uncharacterized protein n=1 Tax=Portunus trituberculatus TaxID=210409 RepID=A0A5B7E2U1_PORTR|nr:hypothetical protein [Portunus trituberculatus]